MLESRPIAVEFQRDSAGNRPQSDSTSTSTCSRPDSSHNSVRIRPNRDHDSACFQSNHAGIRPRFGRTPTPSGPPANYGQIVTGGPENNCRMHENDGDKRAKVRRSCIHRIFSVAYLKKFLYEYKPIMCALLITRCGLLTSASDLVWMGGILIWLVITISWECHFILYYILFKSNEK